MILTVTGISGSVDSDSELNALAFCRHSDCWRASDCRESSVIGSPQVRPGPAWNHCHWHACATVIRHTHTHTQTLPPALTLLPYTPPTHTQQARALPSTLACMHTRLPTAHVRARICSHPFVAPHKHTHRQRAHAQSSSRARAYATTLLRRPIPKHAHTHTRTHARTLLMRGAPPHTRSAPAYAPTHPPLPTPTHTPHAGHARTLARARAPTIRVGRVARGR